MSGISSVTGVPSAFTWFTQTSSGGTQSTTTPSSSGSQATTPATSTSGSTASGTTSTASGSLQSQLVTAISGAVQSAEQSGNVSNLNSVIQGAVQQVLNANGINPATLQSSATAQSGQSAHHHHHHHHGGGGAGGSQSAAGSQSATGSQQASGTTSQSGSTTQAGGTSATQSSSNQQVVQLADATLRQFRQQPIRQRLSAQRTDVEVRKGSKRVRELEIISKAVGWAERSESHQIGWWDSLRSAHPTPAFCAF